MFKRKNVTYFFTQHLYGCYGQYIYSLKYVDFKAILYFSICLISASFSQ